MVERSNFPVGDQALAGLEVGNGFTRLGVVHAVERAAVLAERFQLGLGKGGEFLLTQGIEPRLHLLLYERVRLLDVQALPVRHLGEPAHDLDLIDGCAVETVVEDGFHGAVLGAVVRQRALTGRFEAPGTEGLGQGDNALGGAQVVEYVVRKQPFDECMATGTDKV